jgi:hypothetical protein
MKVSYLAVALFGLLVLGRGDLRAQAYGPYYNPYWDVQYQQYLQYQHYLQWQEYLDYLRQTDPYYELHVMHYQLYLQPYQPLSNIPTLLLRGRHTHVVNVVRSRTTLGEKSSATSGSAKIACADTVVQKDRQH